MSDRWNPNCPCEKTLPIKVSVSEDAGDYSQERCWWCGVPFPPRGRKKYCSTYCRRAAWYVLNPDALRESSSRFRENHPERAREINRRAYERHREARLVLAARWAKENPHRKAAAQERRRASKLGNQGAVDSAAWLAMIVASGGACGYCGEIRLLTMDHRIPLSRGGRHQIGNIIPACKPCNSRKHTGTEAEFRALLESERRLGESEGGYDAPPWPYAGIDVADRDTACSRTDIRAA